MPIETEGIAGAVFGRLMLYVGADTVGTAGFIEIAPQFMPGAFTAVGGVDVCMLPIEKGLGDAGLRSALNELESVGTGGIFL